MTPAPTRHLVAEVRTGTRVIAGTEWPVVTQLIRSVDRGRVRPRWLVVVDLCNGTPSRTLEFRKHRNAQAFFGPLLSSAVDT